MFNYINYKQIYKQLSVDTEEVCQIIVKNNFREEFLKNQNGNVVLVFYHLMAIVYIELKNKRGRKTAERIIKKLMYETAIRLPKEYTEEMILDASSRIVTKYMAMSRYCASQSQNESVQLNFSEELSKGICECFTEDELYFMQDDYRALIGELKVYFDKKVEEYKALIK